MIFLDKGGSFYMFSVLITPIVIKKNFFVFTNSIAS